MKLKTLLKTLYKVEYVVQTKTGATLDEDYISEKYYGESDMYGDYKVLKITTVVNCDTLFITIDF